MKKTIFWKVVLVVINAKWAFCTVDGLSYMDSLSFKPFERRWPRGADPCHPLYWYPRNIPEYCQYNIVPNPMKKVPSPPAPLTIPVHMPIPMPPLFPGPPCPSPPMPPPELLPVPVPASAMPIPAPPFMAPYPMPQPLPFGIPLAPTNPMLPVGSIPFSSYPPAFPFLPPSRLIQQAGMVPGLPGIVSPDGGINILPFSDVYSNVLEKHKQGMIRKRLQQLMDQYDRYPPTKRFRKRRKYSRG